MYLNDNLINMYLKHAQTSRVPARGDVHVFSTYFFSKLLEVEDEFYASDDAQRAAGYAKVRRWAKGVDLFGKKLLFVPINEDLHWSLAVVVNPGAAARADDGLGGSEGPCILQMDSCGTHDAERVARYLRDFLKVAWADREDAPPLENRFEPETLPLVRPMLPRQRNLVDCGVYVLKYFDDLFDADPLLVAREMLSAKGASLGGRFHNEIFSASDVCDKRCALATFLDQRADAYAATRAKRRSCALRAAAGIAADPAAPRLRESRAASAASLEPLPGDWTEAIGGNGRLVYCRPKARQWAHPVTGATTSRKSAAAATLPEGWRLGPYGVGPNDIAYYLRDKIKNQLERPTRA